MWNSKFHPPNRFWLSAKKKPTQKTHQLLIYSNLINRKYLLLRKVKQTFCLNHCRPVILMRKPPLHTHTHTKAQIFTQTAEVRKRSTTSTWSGVKMAHFLNLPGSPCSYVFFLCSVFANNKLVFPFWLMSSPYRRKSAYWDQTYFFLKLKCFCIARISIFFLSWHRVKQIKLALSH